MQRKQTWGLSLVALVVAVILLNNLRQVGAMEPTPSAPEQVAQGGPTNTPAPVILPSGTATNPPSSETPTRTPTQSGPALAEAKNPDTNVRLGPGTDYDPVGRIQPGTQYVVRTKRFEWYQIDFPDSPVGTGWVHNSVVIIIGEESAIPQTIDENVPTADFTIIAREETEFAATQTPGGILTLTARVLVTPQGIFTATPLIGEAPTLAPGQRLPTFTPPPISPTPVRVENLRGGPTSVNADGGALPPLLPITGLLSLSLLGLFISILRRL